MSEPLSPSPSTYELPAPVEVFVVPRPRRRYWLHALLLVATVFTTLVVGARMEFNFLNNKPALSMDDDALSLFPVGWIAEQPSRLLLGVPFAGTLMLILLAHEMGHFLYCVRYGVFATLPFFIPSPLLIGTFGAFIRIRSPIRSRADLFDIGIAGPIAGFVVAVPVLIFGLLASKPLTGDAVTNATNGQSLIVGLPLIFHVVHWAATAMGSSAAAMQAPVAGLYLHPAAMAAWVGMFATALNLLPGGQLDGGHIIFAVNPRLHRPVSFVSIVILLLLSWFYWEGWLLWAVVLRFTGSRHPDVPLSPPLNRTRRVLAIFALIMLVLTLTPAPFVGPNNGLSGYFNKHKAEQQHIAPSK